MSFHFREHFNFRWNLKKITHQIKSNKTILLFLFVIHCIKLFWLFWLYWSHSIRIIMIFDHWLFINPDPGCWELNCSDAQDSATIKESLMVTMMAEANSRQKNKKVSLEEQKQQFPFFNVGCELFNFTSADADISSATFPIKEDQVWYKNLTLQRLIFTKNPLEKCHFLNDRDSDN